MVMKCMQATRFHRGAVALNRESSGHRLPRDDFRVVCPLWELSEAAQPRRGLPDYLSVEALHKLN